MNPPLRTEEDRQALIEGLRDGTIDCIATDHAPHARDEKEVPFEQAPMGTTGLETAFAAVHTGPRRSPGILPLALVVEKLTSGGGLLGLPVPRIEPGAPANLVLVDLAAEWEAGAEGWASRSANCCFAGRTLHGRVLLTVAAGSVAHRERAFALTPPEHEARHRLRPARGRHALRRRGLRRRRPRRRRGRLHHRHVRLPGVDDRRRRSPGSSSPSPTRTSATTGSASARWSASASGRVPRSCARPSTARTRPRPSAAGSTG